VKTFLQILLAVLISGLYFPQTTCAVAASASAGMTCCCTPAPAAICHCHPDRPCPPSCAATQTQASDKQIATGARLTLHSHDRALFAIAATTLKNFVPGLTLDRKSLDTGPPFRGRPPQARLCVWLV
jgi:hypothetical protein